MNQNKVLYIFIDEGGNFDFSIKGTKYFVLTALTKLRPFYSYKELNELKYDLIEQDKNIEYFHATEDRQSVRDSVFDIIHKHKKEVRIDSLIVEKRKTNPSLQDAARFYPRMICYLLTYIVSQYNLKNIG